MHYITHMKSLNVYWSSFQDNGQAHAVGIVRATARGRKKRFAPVLALWHHPSQCCAPHLPRLLGGGMPAQCKALSDSEPARQGAVPVLPHLMEHCPEPKALALIPGADHFFLGEKPRWLPRW
jgi:hypothetical protein